MRESDWDLPERLPAADDVEFTPQDAFYRRQPAAAFAEAVRARRKSATWLPAAGLVATAALTATFLLVVAPWERPSQDQPGPSRPAEVLPADAAFGASGAHRPKSTLRPHAVLQAAPVDLSIMVLGAGGAMPAKDGVQLPPDTQIRFLYDSPDFDYLMVVSVTDRGAVSVLYPMTEGPSIQVVRGLGIPLHGAIQLDDHLGPERFFALFSSAPLAFEQVEAAITESRGGAAAVDGAAWLRELRRLPLDCAQATLLIEKETPKEANDG